MWGARAVSLQSSFDSFERAQRIGIWNALAAFWVGKDTPFAELVAPPLAHLLGELAVKVGEILERSRLAPFLAHEQKRRLRTEQQNGGQRLDGVRLGQGRQALAEGTVAGLIVILQKVDEGRRR